jgi:hypothetical protein
VTDVQEITPEELFNDKQQDIRKAKEAIAGPVPLIPEGPDLRLTMPRGLFVNGVHKREFMLRELNGADEETLAKLKEPGDFFDTVVALGVVSVEDFNLESLALGERQSWLRQLLIGERDQLFLGILRVTFGEKRVIGFTCTTCGEEQEVDLYLSEDFKPREVDDDLTTEVFSYLTTKGLDVEYRLVTGDDQRAAFARRNATTAEQNSIILSKVITRVNGGLIPDQMSFVRSLSIVDRSALLDALVSKQPSIDLGVTTKCAACDADQRLPLGWGDLFRT